MPEPKPWWGQTPYPIAAAPAFPVLLPVVELTVLDPYPCHSCMGYKFDYGAADEARKRGGSKFIPCTVCGNAGAILPGGVMYVDLAAGNDRPRGTLNWITVVARLRSPWPGRGDWYIEANGDEERGMPRVTTQVPSFGLAALQRVTLKAAVEAAYSAGITVSGARALTPFVWPEGWPISRPGDGAIEKLLADAPLLIG